MNADGTAHEREASAPSHSVQASAYKQMPRAFIATVQGEASDIKLDREPSPTITSAHGAAKYRAFIVGGGNTNKDQIDSVARNESEPSFTVATNAPSNTRAWLDTGRVVAMTPRALARFQSFPDSYELPAIVSLATRIIGNAVAPLFAQRLLECFR